MSSSESDFSLDDSDFDDDFEVKKKPKTLKTSSTKTIKPATSPAKNKRKADVFLAPSPVAKTAKTTATTSTSAAKPVLCPTARSSSIAPLTSVVPAASTNGPPVSNEAAARKLILSYMTQQNRPYSVIQVFDNLHKRVGKALVQKVLDSLSGSGGPLKCKEYGKAKIYYLDQLEDTTSSDDMQRISASCDELSERCTALQQELHSFDVELKGLLDTPIDEELDSVLIEVEAKYAELQQRAQHATSSSVTPQQREDSIKAFNFYRDAWRSRKLKAMEIIDMLADGMEKKQKDVVVTLDVYNCLIMIRQMLVGIETDEDEGVTLPSSLKG